MLFKKNIVLTLAVALCFGVVAHPGTSHAYKDTEEVAISDPIEPVNRVVYGFNRLLDKTILRPLAKTYRNIIPEYIRDRVHSVLVNLSEPVTFLNSALQGDVPHTHETFWRFTINSTMGIGGLFDVAGVAGLKHRGEDFGQTMGRYGSGNGPYLMIPILGPSNARDIVGTVADAISDPFNYAFTEYGTAARTATYGIDKRESMLEILGEIDRVSLDPYASIRSLYTQKRADDIANGK